MHAAHGDVRYHTASGLSRAVLLRSSPLSAHAQRSPSVSRCLPRRRGSPPSRLSIHARAREAVSRRSRPSPLGGLARSRAHAHAHADRSSITRPGRAPPPFDPHIRLLRQLCVSAPRPQARFCRPRPRIVRCVVRALLHAFAWQPPQATAMDAWLARTHARTDGIACGCVRRGGRQARARRGGKVRRAAELCNAIEMVDARGWHWRLAGKQMATSCWQSSCGERDASAGYVHVRRRLGPSLPLCQCTPSWAHGPTAC